MEIAEVQVSYNTKNKEHLKIRDSRSTYELLLSCWNKNTIELQEEFKVLLLNRSNQILGIYSLSKGGVSGTIVDSKLLFSVALKANASGVILSHNHPSGNTNPSEVDKAITNKIKQASKLLDIELLDHLVITKDSYYSFADNFEI